MLDFYNFLCYNNSVDLFYRYSIIIFIDILNICVNYKNYKGSHSQHI